MNSYGKVVVVVGLTGLKPTSLTTSAASWSELRTTSLTGSIASGQGDEAVLTTGLKACNPRDQGIQGRFISTEGRACKARFKST
jgi:hypothetical protein